MEGTSDPVPARVSDATDSFAEQDLEVEGRSRTALLPPTGNGEQGARPPEGVPTARREQAVVTRYGCERGELFGGSLASRGARPDSPRPVGEPLRWLGVGVAGAGFSETRRTPRPAAGCNKPANLQAEEAVEVVQNHTDGTGLSEWTSESRSATGTSRGSGRLESTSVERRTARRSVSWPSHADESHERRLLSQPAAQAATSERVSNQGERRVL